MSHSRFTPLWVGAGLLALAAHLLVTSPHDLIASVVALVGAVFIVWRMLLSRTSPTAAALERASRSPARILGIPPHQLAWVILGLTLSMSARAAGGDGALAHSPMAPFLWVAGISLTVLGCRDPHPVSRTGGWSRGEWILVLALFLGSLVLRGWQAGVSPYVFSGDEGSAGLTAWEFLSGERDNLLSLGWFSFPALYFWLLSFAQIIFGRSVEALRWVSALGGALTVWALYWAGRRLFNRRVAFWSAVWLASFHHHIFFSRVAYNNIWDGLFLILSVGALWDGVSNKYRAGFLLAGLAIGLSQYFYTTAHAIPLIILIWFILLFRRSADRRALFAHFLCMGVTALSVFAPLALLYLQHPESLFFTASRTSILVPGWTAGAAEALGTTSFGLVLEQTWVTVLGFSVAELQGVYFEPGVPLLFGVSAWLFMLGLVWLLLATRDSRLTPALLTIAATCIIGGLSIQAPNAQRMLLLPPMLALLVVVPLDWISVRVERLVFPIQHLMLIALSSLILIAVYENTSFFFRDYLQREEYGSLNGEVTQAMAVLLEEQGWQDEILFIGGERMSVFSIPSLPYLIPEVNASDLEPPYDLPKSMDPEQERWLIILPEMSAARARLEGACDSGATIPRYNRRGILLFHYCQLDPT